MTPVNLEESNEKKDSLQYVTDNIEIDIKNIEDKDSPECKDVILEGKNWDIKEELDVNISDVISPDIDDEEVDFPLECVYGPPSFYEEYENFMHDPYVRRYIEEREARKKRDR